MHKLLSILLTGSVLFTLAACQKSGDGGGSDTAKPIFLGNLDQKVNEIYSADNEPRMDLCDTQWRPRILELSRVLEEKRKDIQELAQKRNSENKVVGTDFGSFKFIDDASEPGGKDEWTSFTSSWSEVLQYYEVIKDDPTNSYWVNINRMARSIVMDDESRIVYGNFYGLTKDSEPVITAIKNKIVACSDDSNCTRPDLTKSEENFLNENPLYDYYINYLRSSKHSYTEKRGLLSRFKARILVNADRYGYHKEELARVEGKTLVIPMDLSALGDDGAQKFIAINEKAWNIDPEYKIKIEFVKDKVTKAYHLDVDNEQGERAWVNWNDKIMQLHNWGRTKTFTHEFGHVLGFKDKYYTTWNMRTCAYTFESNAGDLMSNSDEGAVLPRHWEKLKSIYWPEVQKPGQ